MLPDQFIICYQPRKRTWTCANTFYFDLKKGVIANTMSSSSSQGVDVFGLALNFLPHSRQDYSELELDAVTDWLVRGGRKDEELVRKAEHFWLHDVVMDGKTKRDGYVLGNPDPDNFRSIDIPKNTAIRFEPILTDFWTRQAIREKETNTYKLIFRMYEDSSDFPGGSIYDEIRQLDNIEETKKILGEIWEKLSPSQVVFIKPSPDEYHKDETRATQFKDSLSRYFSSAKLRKLYYTEASKLFSSVVDPELEKPTKNEIKKAITRHLKLHPKTHKLFKLLAFAGVITTNKPQS